MNKKSIGWGVGLVILIILVVTVILNMNQKNGDSAPIKIGAAIALTGYGASFGQSELNAIEILKDKYPSVEFYIEDNKSDPKEGVMAVRKLIDVHEVDIVYCELTTVANAVVSITNEQEKVLLAAVYLTDLLDRSPYAIRNLPRGVDESRLLLSRLFELSPSEKKIALAGSNDEFGRSSLGDFKGISSDFNVKIAYEDMIPDNEQQLRSLAKKLVAISPDAVYAASLMPSLGLLIKELRLANFKGNILTTDAFAFPYIQSAAGPYAKDTLYVDFPSTNALKEFSSVYRERFSQEVSSTAVLCYDGLSLIIDASLQSGKKLKDVVKVLDGTKHNGLYGEIIVKGREIIYPLIVKTAK